MQEFKGNPIPVAEAPREKPKPVTTNVTVKKEGSLARKFFAQDLKSTGTSVFNETVIPSAKRFLSELVKKSIDFLLYGSFSNTGNTDYRGISTRNITSLSSPITRQAAPIPQNYAKPNNVTSINSVEFNVRAEAEQVLYELQSDCKQFGMVSVLDFYDKIGLDTEFTDNGWGWDDLSGASVKRTVNDKYAIVFPKPRSLK